MSTRRLAFLAAVSITWLFLAPVGAAQQVVYKWVDEEGVVHFGESPPEGVDAERITTQAAPSQPAQPAAPAAPAPANPPQAAQPPVAAAPAAVQKPASEMSLAELNQRCEAAREAKIAPLRAAEIERCKSQQRSDPGFCERFNATFGDASRGPNGVHIPRMFHDLPECVEAEQRQREGGQ